MTEHYDPPSRLESLVLLLEPRFRRDFLELVRRLKSLNAAAGLERQLRAGQVEPVLRYLAQAANRLGSMYGTGFGVAGDEASKFLEAKVRVPLDFSRTHWRAVDHVGREAARLAREMTEGTRIAVRQVLADAQARGINPREAAREVRESIGLTARQVAAVNRYRELLEANDPEALTRKLRDRRFDARVGGEEPIPADVRRRMVDRYRERMLAHRATTIARTEMLRAANAGTDEMYRQAGEAGVLELSELVRRWNTAKDERVRLSHALMHGQERGMDEPFTTGDGERIMRPGDPDAPAAETINCRCAIGTRFRVRVPLEGVVAAEVQR